LSTSDEHPLFGFQVEVIGHVSNPSSTAKDKTPLNPIPTTLVAGSRDVFLGHGLAFIQVLCQPIQREISSTCRECLFQGGQNSTLFRRNTTRPSAFLLMNLLRESQKKPNGFISVGQASAPAFRDDFIGGLRPFGQAGMDDFVQ